MHKYNDFLLEKKFNKWEQLSLNENFVTSLQDNIEKFLNKEYEFDTAKFEKTVANLYYKFRNNIKIVTIITTLLLSGFMAKPAVVELLNTTGFSEQQQEQIITKSLEHKDKITKIPKIKGEMKKFINAIAQKESSMDPTSINSLGYIGKYQFGKSALKDLGLNIKINTNKFRNNPSIFPEHKQDEAMVKLLKLNKKYLGNYIDEYVGKTIAGVKITKSGLLAGSHLVGAGSVKEFLDSNGKIIPKDGNEVPVTEYIKKFGGFNLTF